MLRGSGTLRGIAKSKLVHAESWESIPVTHIVKQSNMNATATGLIVVATSSGIGGASFRLPSLYRDYSIVKSPARYLVLSCYSAGRTLGFHVLIFSTRTPDS